MKYVCIKEFTYLSKYNEKLKLENRIISTKQNLHLIYRVGSEDNFKLKNRELCVLACVLELIAIDIRACVA